MPYHMRTMKHAPLLRTATLLFCFYLLLTACGKEGGQTPDDGPPPPPRPARGVPDDVPLYLEDSDAKKVDYSVTDTDIVLTMETINGPLSPITYYRGIEQNGWKIVQDTEDAGGTLRATKKDRELSVTFEALPGGGGTVIVLKTTKEG
ncbi:MAG: hypothetical protein UY87_C0021G0011 [Candidatus Peribacteria bacterium GW2011_GWC2_54_8]|nr:MAG: hypothetical protein UY90_C0085G0005 [Candidatus Peregrinibacteria bacterium GW2011_GWA2_54_9]KKW40466.1 MAG: hypothetical protein UY87_C0021G0011 [Candidatus Peribacteria bacterium GW2011_GWC2_54_8]